MTMAIVEIESIATTAIMAESMTVAMTAAVMDLVTAMVTD
jgi:hypothetical protein